MQLATEETARNDAEAKLEATSESLKEMQNAHDLEKLQFEEEVKKLKDEVRVV